MEKRDIQGRDTGEFVTTEVLEVHIGSLRNHEV